MKKQLVFLMVFCATFLMSAQQDAWVYLTDKQNVMQSIANPSTILSQRAIDRKNAHNVPIDAKDVPVNETYISQLKTAAGITMMAKSKWFNAVHVRGSKTAIDNLATNFSFIDHIIFADKSLNQAKNNKPKQEAKFTETTTNFVYGNTANQVQMIKADKLHIAGFTGSGMVVAVIDAGFPNVNTMTGFKRLREAINVYGTTNKILDTYDFVQRDTDVYTNTTSNHGTLVLSTMAGYVENQFVGTAPDASYYLFITEDGPNENPVEESYWVEAAERADSLGVDVINSSLGYTTFDNTSYNYTNADMNGNTAFITKGANIAFQKGMLIVNSAGNSGNGSWQIVGAPADAAGVFSIGAVNASGNYASFSSKGSSFQPTQKPDVVAQGQASAVIRENDVISTANGTSFSSPIMAGGIVCLWEALPNKTNAEIMQIVRASASQSSNPDYLLGYGIPNLESAYLTTLNNFSIENKTELQFYPNPASHNLHISMDTKDIAKIYIFDILGKLILETEATTLEPEVNIARLSKGIYLVKLQTSKQTKTAKLLKN